MGFLSGVEATTDSNEDATESQELSGSVPPERSDIATQFSRAAQHLSTCAFRIRSVLSLSTWARRTAGA